MSSLSSQTLDSSEPPTPCAIYSGGGPDASLPTVELLGMSIHRVTMQQAVDHVITRANRRSGGWVMTPNVDILRRWKRDESFRKSTHGVTFKIADGMPLVWASRLMRRPLPQRLTGADLTRELIAAAAAHKVSVFFLGGAPGAAEETARRMQQQHPHLAVAGTWFPPYGFEQDEQQWQQMQQAVVQSNAQIVFVALGSPRQERVIERLSPLMPHAWWLGIGATFSFLSGQVPRAPRWMQHCGMEWVHRLACEPRRLAHRYLVDDLPFATWLLASSICKRWHRPSRDGNQHGLHDKMEARQ